MQASCFGYIKVKELEVSGLLSPQRKINAWTFPAGMAAAAGMPTIFVGGGGGQTGPEHLNFAIKLLRSMEAWFFKMA